MKALFTSIVASLVIVGPVLAESSQPTDDDVRQRIIQESIARYPGNCPCPYNRASNGSKCGGRSAYSKPGGYSPLCYPRDVSDERVRQYKKQNGL